MIGPRLVSSKANRQKIEIWKRGGVVTGEVSSASETLSWKQ